MLGIRGISIFRMILKPHHVGISVANLADSIKWYEKILSFSLVWEKYFPTIETKIAFLRNETFEIELFEANHQIPLPNERFLPNTDLQTQGTKHIAFEVSDIIKLFEEFDLQGVDIAISPRESPPKDALFGFIRDPSGVLIEFVEKK
jgi:methylmalonyl-CoA/ethylmalonyl-CoA epimerase